MILRCGAALCLAYFFACGVRFSFKTSLLWGWTVAAAYFFALSYLPETAARLALTPFVLYLVYLALFLRKSPGRDAASPGDALLVPGSRTDGAMPLQFAETRAKAALALLEQKKVPVVLSGGTVGRESVPEAAVLREYLVSAGADADLLLLETSSRSTWENLSLSAPLLEKARHVTVVTHPFHRRRVLALAKKALPGKEVDFAALPGETGLLGIHLLARESFTFLVDFLRGRAAL